MIKQKKQPRWAEKVYLTKHFKERYMERVLGDDSKVEGNLRNTILSDMNNRMNKREQLGLIFFCNCKEVIIPMQSFQIVVKEKNLITVLKKGVYDNANWKKNKSYKRKTWS